MEYCVNYSIKSSVLDKVDEIRIFYSNYKDIYNIIDFLKTHTQQTTIVSLIASTEEIIKDKIIENLFSIAHENPELKFKIELPKYDKDLIELVKDEQEVKWFIGQKINNWDTLVGFIKLGVSDVLVCEEICFELDKIAAVAGEAGVKVRVFANVAQSEFKQTPALHKFFIRPEDVEAYEPYVNVIEFFGKDTKRIDTYFKIYSQDKRWFGRLDEIILDFDSDLDNRYTIPRFAEKRIRCNKSCVKGGKCHICDRIEELSKNLESANLLVMIDKEKKLEEVEEGNGERASGESRDNEGDIESISE